MVPSSSVSHQIAMALVTTWSSGTKPVVQPLGIRMALLMATGVMDINTDPECYRARDAGMSLCGSIYGSR